MSQNFRQLGAGVIRQLGAGVRERAEFRRRRDGEASTRGRWVEGTPRWSYP